MLLSATESPVVLPGFGVGSDIYVISLQQSYKEGQWVRKALWWQARGEPTSQVRQLGLETGVAGSRSYSW